MEKQILIDKTAKANKVPRETVEFVINNLEKDMKVLLNNPIDTGRFLQIKNFGGWSIRDEFIVYDIEHIEQYDLQDKVSRYNKFLIPYRDKYFPHIKSVEDMYKHYQELQKKNKIYGSVSRR